MPTDRMMDGMDAAWMLGGLVITVVVLAIILVGLYAVVRLVQDRSDAGSSKAATQRSSALAILEERYARGEIDHEEFEERRRRLSQ